MTVPSSDEILQTQQRGYDAYLRGTSPTKNPYRMAANAQLCMAWIRGFNWARTERAREIEREQAT